MPEEEAQAVNPAPYFSQKVLEEIRTNRTVVGEQYRRLMMGYSAYNFTHVRAREHATHGFSRRLKTICRCIDNVFSILPPDRDDLPSADELTDATINIQAFLLNVFGAIDNLAWVWVHENGVTLKGGGPLRNRDVGLGPGKNLVRKTLSAEFQQHLEKFDEWFDSIGTFRDALAHRIPLYIPPYGVSKDKQAAYREFDERMTNAIRQLDFEKYDRLLMEQLQLATFKPWMQHSYEEGASPIIFHAQLLCDFHTLAELGEKMLEELGKSPRPGKVS